MNLRPACCIKKGTHGVPLLSSGSTPSDLEYCLARTKGSIRVLSSAGSTASEQRCFADCLSFGQLPNINEVYQNLRARKRCEALNGLCACILLEMRLIVVI